MISNKRAYNENVMNSNGKKVERNKNKTTAT